LIYLDYNATTPLCDEARQAMLPYLDKFFGNPSSIHAAGREARAAVDNARDKIAGLLAVKSHEIVFTSGGTESCNLALLGLARSKFGHGAHIICNKAEHHAVLNTVEYLEKHEGFSVTWLDLAADGRIDLNQLAESIQAETRLVSIMTANNETGVIQPIREISQICRARGVLFHSDMVQSFGKIEFDISLVDAASFAAHKFYGPKGVGFLYLRSGLSIQPIAFGGAHENQRRAGTENVAGIAGMAAAADVVSRGREKEQCRQAALKDRLLRTIQTFAPNAVENGTAPRKLANTLHVSFVGADSEMLLIAMDLKGVCASSGSACMVGSVSASHVLLAMGLPLERARSAIRFSLGKHTTEADVDSAAAAIKQVIDRLAVRKPAAYAAV